MPDNPTILVVDDEEMVRINLLAYLEDEGYEVISAGSGEAALDLLESQTADLGIIDMRLPGMDGNELISTAKKRYPHMHFVIHTGSTEYSLPEYLMELGLSEELVMHKPLADMGVLVDKLRQLMSADCS